MPNRCAATSNDTRVRVDGLSNRQAIAVVFRAAAHHVGPFFISSARSSSALSCVAVRSAIRSRSDGAVVGAMAVMKSSFVERGRLRGGTQGRSAAVGEQALDGCDIFVLHGDDERVDESRLGGTA